MGVTIREIRFQRIHKKLKNPFVTSLQTVNERESIMVTVLSDNGLEGFGECVAFSTPWYTEETVESCAFVMERVLKPLLLDKILSSPHEVATVFAPVKGNHMAKAAIEMAVWDLFAKYEGVPLWQYIGGTYKDIPAGVVVAARADSLLCNIEQAASKGYNRIKVKITPKSDRALLREAINRYPDIMFFADANGGFNKDSFDQLIVFDDIGFSLIEQPFGEQEWELHAQAKKQLKTPICLDESIKSYQDVKRMIELQAADIIVLKMGRLGGWHETLKVVDLCRENGVGMWVGGMIELGVSKAHNLALASLPDIGLPGDFSDSRHFWEEDVVAPEVEVIDGKIKLQQQAGIGYSVDLNKSRL